MYLFLSLVGGGKVRLVEIERERKKGKKDRFYLYSSYPEKGEKRAGNSAQACAGRERVGKGRERFVLHPLQAWK